MSLSNYGELKTAAANWLNRSDLTACIPDFVGLAHSDINADVRHWRMLNRATATLDSQYTQYPDDFVEADSVFLQHSPPLQLEVVLPRTIVARRAEYGHSTGRPRLIAFGEEIMTSPVPDQAYIMEMSYYQRLAAFSADGSTNWVLTYFPNLYLYGTLKQAAPFLHEDERIQVWDALYEQGLARLKRDNMSHALSAGVSSAPGIVF
jgi:hypothetical protein